MITVFELLKHLPKSNCGQCGEPTCMAFATKVVTAGLDATKCPHFISIPDGLDALDHKAPHSLDKGPETQLLRELREKIKGVELGKLAGDLGGRIILAPDSGDEILELPFFNDKILVSKESLISRRGEELDPRDQILIYNYCFFGGKGPVSDEWVGLESFPNSVSKVSTLRRYTEDKLAEAFSRDPELIRQRVEAIGGVIVHPCNADLCFRIKVFPKIELRFHVWQAEPEEGFEAFSKVLYNLRAIDFLDLESLVFAAERAVEKILE